MRLIPSISCLVLLVGAIPNSSDAQNVPNGWGPATASAGVTLPTNYNAYPNTTPTLFNYCRVWTPRKQIWDTTGLDLYAFPYIQVNTSYVNGWGKTIESISRFGGGATQDIIVPQDHRSLLNSPEYLPYNIQASSKFQVAPFTAQKSFYNSQYPGEGDNAYSRTNISSNSSSGTSVTKYEAGASLTGAGRGVTSIQIQNSTSNPIRIWNLDVNLSPVTSGTYNSNELFGTKTTGQHNALSIVWTDKTGQTICKQLATSAGSNPTFLTTYYVYNSAGRLSHILTPKAVEAIASNSWQITNSIITGLCYVYKYNQFGQVIEKYVPGKLGPENTVYDLKHRPILSQTPLLASQGKWTFQVFDCRDRVCYSGLISENMSRSDWQNYVENPPAASITPFYMAFISLTNDYSSGGYPSTTTYFDINTYNYYDNYDFGSGSPLYGRSFDNSASADYLAGVGYITPQSYLFVQGLLTASSIKIVDNSSTPHWIHSVFFYDTKGELIQSQTLNPWNNTNWDVNTKQYDFVGNVALSIMQHNAWSSNTKPTSKVVKKYIYDSRINKLSSIAMKTDAETTYHNIATYTYDNFGRTAQKTFGAGAEIQNYTYNIRGQLTGINPLYAAGNSYVDQHFGVDLSYDCGFYTPRYDGSISGMIWRGAGSASPKRAYGYNYDVANRLVGADFTEYVDPNYPPSSALYSPWWQNSITDYSLSNVKYDANGNIAAMKQRGVGLVAGVSQPVDMDRLAYTYTANTNSLERVEDTVTINYQLQDFVNGNSLSTDYDYDEDGNLKADANKHITNISYNDQDLPLSITSTSNGVIDNIYSADGALVQKTITYPGGSPSPWVYKYWGPFVYRNDSLLYVLHDEGRARWMPDSSKFKYDFFVKDHLGNVRDVVTSDVSTNASDYLATYELASAGLENLVFSNIDPLRAIKPADTNPLETRAARLNGNEDSTRIGTSILLHVMAGDRFNLSTQAYYNSAQDALEDIHTASFDMLGSLLNTLSTGAGGFSTLGHEGHGGGSNPNQSTISDLLSIPNYNEYDAIKESQTDPDKPRAYLNYISFDEDMHVIPEQSGAIQIDGSCYDAWGLIGTANDVVVSQNGYIAVYISNEQYADVYFDNVQILHWRGRLLEEQHYYPFGLTIQAGANTTIPNKFLYQGKELQDEVGLQLYDFHARQYDPQIGRFWGIDPANQFPSGYTGMGNDPANMIDPTGMQVYGYTGSAYHTGAEGFIASHLSRNEWNMLGYADDPRESEQESLEIQYGGAGGAQGQDRDANNDTPDPDPQEKSKENVNKDMVVSEKGEEFIKSYETLRLDVYDALNPKHKWDGKSSGDWTIGWGHKLQKGEKLTKLKDATEANELFQKDLKEKGTDKVNSNVKVVLTQNQYDALVSYTFNAGAGNTVIGTKLVKELKAGNYDKAAKQMDIITGGGRKLNGLIERRANEQNMWINNVYINHH